MTRKVTLCLALCVLSCQAAWAERGKPAPASSFFVSFAVMSVVFDVEGGGASPVEKLKGGALVDLAFSSYSPRVLTAPDGGFHVFWEGLHTAAFKGSALTLAPLGLEACHPGWVDPPDDGRSLQLIGTCTVHLRQTGEGGGWEAESDLDPYALDANVAALAFYRAQRPKSEWSGFITDYEFQVTNAVATAEIMRAATAESSAKYAAYQAAKEEALPKISFDDLVGIIGKVHKDPAVCELLWLDCTYDESPARSVWPFEGFEVVTTYSIVGAVNISKDIPGWTMGQTKEALIERFGPPDPRSEMGAQQVVNWVMDDWVLTVAFNSQEPMTSYAAYLRHPTGVDFLQKPHNSRNVGDLPASTLCLLAGKSLNDPAVTPLLQSMTSYPDIADDRSSWVYPGDGVRLRLDEKERIESVVVSGPKGGNGVYKGLLPLGASAYDQLDKLTSLYGAQLADRSYYGNAGMCRVGFDVDGFGSLVKLWVYEPAAGQRAKPMSRDEWVQRSNAIKFRCEDELQALKGEMPAMDDSGPTVRSVGPATAVDSSNGDGTVTRTYEQQGIEWVRGPDNTAAIEKTLRLQAAVQEVESRCAAELEALGENPE